MGVRVSRFEMVFLLWCNSAYAHSYVLKWDIMSHFLWTVTVLGFVFPCSATLQLSTLLVVSSLYSQRRGLMKCKRNIWVQLPNTSLRCIKQHLSFLCAGEQSSALYEVSSLSGAIPDHFTKN